MKKTKKDTATAATIRATLSDIVLDELQALPEYLPKLTPSERARFVSELLQYVAPKINKVTADALKPTEPADDWTPQQADDTAGDYLPF